MPLPDFCIAPHEAGDLAPDEPSCAPAMARVQLDDGHHYLVRRIINKSPQAELLIRREAPAPMPMPLLRFWAENCPLARLSEEWKQGSFGRRLLFDANLRLIRSPDNWRYSLELFGRGVWCNWRDASHRRTVFEWQPSPLGKSVSWLTIHEKDEAQKIARWLAALEDDEVERQIQAMASDENSEFSFAQRWLGLSEGDKNRLLILNSKAELNFLRKLLCAASGEALLGSTEPLWAWFLPIQYFIFGRHKFVEPFPKSWIQTRSGERQPSARQKKLLDLIFENFALRLDRDLAIKCIKGHMWKKAGWHCVVAVRAPSAHELIEAKILLRDFLHDKVSADELRELLDEA